MAANETPDPYANYDVTAKQNATNERSAAARLDRTTEDALYKLYRSFFQEAEQTRRWNLWLDFPWDEPPTRPTTPLIEAVVTAYHAELFLPDYAARALYYLRSSRGRAWFLTRWTYEEGKHLLALAEWLLHCGAYSNDQLRAQSDDLLLRYTWEPPFEDAAAILADFLLWELREADRYRTLRHLAVSENETLLAALLDEIIKDEDAHRAFLRQCLTIIAEIYPDQVTGAVRRIAERNTSGDDGADFGGSLLAELGITPGAPLL
ncbi:MAG: hypothetical protein H7Z41_13130 [Cytophagales bacterium]|nr:hypothetical protein [Armatimonadota bacterium]